MLSFCSFPFSLKCSLSKFLLTRFLVSFVAMARRVVSSVPIHKLKLIRRSKKKKFLLRRVIDYLRSDTYMFAPLLHSHRSDFCSRVSASFSGVDANEPIREKNKKLLEKVKEYMISDDYLYAHVVAHKPFFPAAIGSSSPQDKATEPVLGTNGTETNKWKESMKKSTEETRDPGQLRRTMRMEELSSSKYPSTRTTIIRHTQLQKETGKRMVQQKCNS